MKRVKSHWEFQILSNEWYSSKKLTAICANCNEPLFCNPYKNFMGKQHKKYGTILFSAFYPQEMSDTLVRITMEDAVKHNIAGHLPRFCACCGAEMAEIDDCNITIREAEVKEK